MWRWITRTDRVTRMDLWAFTTILVGMRTVRFEFTLEPSELRRLALIDRDPEGLTDARHMANMRSHDGACVGRSESRGRWRLRFCREGGWPNSPLPCVCYKPASRRACLLFGSGLSRDTTNTPPPMLSNRNVWFSSGSRS